MAEKEGELPKKKRRLSLSLKGNRFKKVEETAVTEARKGFVPDNTARSTKWAMGNFEAWKGSLQDEDAALYGGDILATDDPKLLCSCLCKYVLETRKENGDPYPPRSIFLILSGLLRYMRGVNPDAFNILDHSDPNFVPLHNVLDTHFRQLHSEGVGTRPAQREIVTFEEEDLFWTSGVIGLDSPRQLLHAVFYYCGLSFCLRGGDEHRSLKVSQLKKVFVSDPENPGSTIACYEYVEHGSKNNLGGIKQVRSQQGNKIVRQFANPKLGDRCFVKIVDLYLSKRPQFADDSPDVDTFYLRPLDKFDQDKAWYYTKAIGHNTLKMMLKTMCQEAGVPYEGKLNHSLRATSTTRMLDAGVAEKVIMDRTGHRSLDGLKLYARTTSRQQQQVSQAIAGDSEVAVMKDCNSLVCTTNHTNVEEKMKGIVSNSGQMSGCVFNISLKM